MSGEPVRRVPRWLRSVAIGAAVLLVLVIYAYGFQVTKVDLEETRSERRQPQLVRILRALARPEILQFTKAELIVNAPFFMPCPPSPPQLHEPDPLDPYILVRPDCTEPGGKVVIDGTMTFALGPPATQT